MSGIAGIYFLDGKKVNPQDLDQMITSLAPRGPDGRGAWLKDSIGLAHTMLWATPESLLERQPLIRRSEELILTADARIDNREGLISELNIQEKANEVGDGEIILSAYSKWGERFVDRLEGDFAFAIWDHAKKLLFCGRDSVGVKPFYYYSSPTIFAFASEIKALLKLREVPRHLNELKVAEHLVQFFEDKSITFYKEILRLPPAHTISIQPDQTSLRSYWSLDSSREIRFKTDEEYVSAFQQVFNEAVRCRLRSPYEIGSALSGGLDSSSIACTASRLLKEGKDKSLHTFSAIFPGLPEEDLRQIDERSYVDAVLSNGEFIQHFIRADLLSPLKDLERDLGRQDEAFQAPNLYMHSALYECAQANNVRVFLDGIDGDVTVSHGMEYMPDLARTGRWAALLNEGQALSRRQGVAISPRRIIWRFAVMPLIPEVFFNLRQRLRGENDLRWLANTAINRDFAKRIGLEKHIQSLSQNGVGVFSNARQKHRYSLESGLIPLGLELLDKTAAGFSLEPRYPFFDRRLMQFCLALPPEQKLAQGWTRLILRRAMQGVLPEEVRWRFSKSDLSPNFRRNLLAFEQSELNQVIYSDLGTIGSYVDLPVLRQLYEQYLSQPASSETEMLAVYGSFVLARWMQSSEFGA